MATGIRGVITKKPGLGITLDLNNDMAWVKEIHNKLSKKNISPQERAALHTREDILMRKIVRTQELVMAVEPPSDDRILEIAAKDYRIATENVDSAFLTKYPSLSDYAAEVKNAATHGRAAMKDIESLKVAGGKLDADMKVDAAGPDYGANLTRALTVIKGFADPERAAQAVAEVRRLKDNPGEALKYAKDLAATLVKERNIKNQKPATKNTVQEDNFSIDMPYSDTGM